MIRSTHLFGAALVIGSLAIFGGCEDKSKRPAAGGSSSAAPKHDDHDHAAGDKHDHAGDKHDDHGPVVELGTAAVGSFQVKASRDGAVKAGEEAPVDLWVTPSGATKVGTVRAWIGTQDAKGSIKAKMELEKDNYHSHVEVPKPLPTGSKLWVEVEDDKGAKSLGSFDLKA